MSTVNQYLRAAGLANPFGAPIYYADITESTMTDARIFIDNGASDGTVLYCGFQRSGRGRVIDRSWESKPHEGLLCTVILRRPPIPGFTLRIGLAVSRAFDAYLPPLTRTSIKWPNDVLYNGKKLSGILCESNGSAIMVGVGFNISQKDFPPDLHNKATSLSLVINNSSIPTREEMLETFLSELYTVLSESDWSERVSERLWLMGEPIVFHKGDPGSPTDIRGIVRGIGSQGELLLETGEGVEALFSGEM